MRKLIGTTLIIFGIFILIFVAYRNSRYSKITRPFSPYSILTGSFETYKRQFVNNDGRVLDHAQKGITTSEGQSYLLLRSVWVDDKPMFDKSWKWTNDNLKQPDSNIFGWKWGLREDKTYGLLSKGGENSASDADQDIALALIFASKKWNDSKYLEEAEKILPEIWEKETALVGERRYLLAGDWAISQEVIIVNPSYFAPYAWRIFAEVDKEHDWNSLLDPSYELLEISTKDPLDKGKSANLPPDWIEVSRDSGKITASRIPGLKTDYSFDAIRIPFRVAMDYSWNKDPKAKKYLELLSFLQKEYAENKKLKASYTHDGKVILNVENPTMYATSLGYFLVSKKDMANKIYQDKIIKLYANDKDSFKIELPYYEQNWLWFGVALYNEFLPNLYKNE